MLPARIGIRLGEALDSYLEQVADANDLLTKDLFRLLIENRESIAPTAAFMMTKPDAALVDRIEELTGMAAQAVERATLARYDGGIPLNLDGLNPREHHSFRNVVNRGWFPPHGTQICPICLSDKGIWQLSWRSSTSAVCLEYGTYLVSECSGCKTRFRSRRRNPLRPVIGPEQPCGNALGDFSHCEHSVMAEPAAPAPARALDAGRRIINSIESMDVSVLGNLLPPAQYLAELKNLTTLLLHIASHPNSHHFAIWAADVQAEAAARSCELRGPRWGIRPPESSAIRGLALAEADSILSQSDSDIAVEQLMDWFELIPATSGGPRGWLVNRTAMSPVLSWLAIQALSSRRQVGLQLDHQDEPGALPLSAIPQILDERTYRRYFAGMLATQESTRRLYASLCLARAQRPGSSWSAAATSIGLDPDVGRRTSRAASSRLLVAPPVLAEAVNSASAVLPRRRNYRVLERRVVRLAQSSDTWFREWCATTKPQRRQVALPCAITWM